MNKLNAQVAVIIPFYNRAQYVKRCVESVLGQSYQDIIAICVDDGSTDDTLSLLKNYAEEDERIICLHQENKGVSAARNTAIRYLEENCHIEWVCFLDSDDYYEEPFINDLLDNVKKANASIVISQFKALNEDGRIISIAENSNNIGRIATPNELLSSLTDHSLFPVLWAKLYKASLILGHYFDERLIMSEDYLFLCGVFHRSKAAYFCASDHYVYQTGNAHASLTKVRMSTKHMISDAFANIEMISEIRTFSEEYNPRKLEQNVIDAFSVHLFGLYGRCNKQNVKSVSLSKEFLEIKSFEKKNHIIKRAKPKTRDGRILRVLYLYCRPLFYIAYRIHRRRD